MCLNKEMNFFLSPYYSGLLEIAAHCSWVSKFIAYSMFNVVCFLGIRCLKIAFIAFETFNENVLMLWKFSILRMQILKFGVGLDEQIFV